MGLAVTGPLRREVARALPSRPFALRFWDGSELPATAGMDGDGTAPPTFTVRSPRAIAHALRAPGQLGLGRAYVAGELAVDDLDAVIRLLDTWRPPPIAGRARVRLMLAALAAMGLTLPPRRPASELAPRGTRHSRERDARAVRHHYDVSNDFFRLFLGPTMTYSCGVWARSGASDARAGAGGEARAGLREARASEGRARARRRLRLGRVRAARGRAARRARHRDHALPAQASLARERVREAGLETQVDIRHRRLPRAGGRAVRRDRLDRHGRARRRGADRHVRGTARRSC